MKPSYRSIFLTALILCLWGAPGPAFSADDEVIDAGEAEEYIGDMVTVCGVIADTHYAQTSRGRPTYLNFEEAFPNAVFTAVVWEDDRESFPYALDALLGLDICVYGKIGIYRGKPQMKLVRPEQISPKK